MSWGGEEEGEAKHSFIVCKHNKNKGSTSNSAWRVFYGQSISRKSGGISARQPLLHTLI
jgi:hypothetical protein